MADARNSKSNRLKFWPVIREAERTRLAPGRVEVEVLAFPQCHLNAICTAWGTSKALSNWWQWLGYTKERHSGSATGSGHRPYGFLIARNYLYQSLQKCIQSSIIAGDFALNPRSLSWFGYCFIYYRYVVLISTLPALYVLFLFLHPSTVFWCSVQNIFIDVPEYFYRCTENKNNMYTTGEAGTPDINTGGAGTPAKPA